MSAIAEAEHDHIPVIEEILSKKSAGRPLTPEEFLSLIQFVDRVERRTVEQKKAEAAAEQEATDAARSEIPEAAFDMDVAALELPEHVYTILTEAEHRTVGNLMMAMKLNPDSVLSFSGIGPKAMQAIETALTGITFPEPEVPVVIPEAEVPETVEQTGESVTTPETSISEETPSEPVVEVEVEVTPPDGEGKEEKDFDEIFSLEHVMAAPPVVEEESEEERNKKKEKKIKKGRELEFDEKRGEVVARKKHKRGDDDVVLDEWE